MMNKFGTFFVLWVLSMGFGCGPYSFSGAALPHIKTVNVPLFADKTAEFGVKEELTNAIIDAFTRDNTLKIAGRRDADSVLQGTLVRVVEKPGAYNAEEKVQEIQVYVTVEIKFMEVKKSKVIWQDRITQFGTYAPDDPVKNTRNAAISEAIAKIADEVLSRTVSGW